MSIPTGEFINSKYTKVILIRISLITTVICLLFIVPSILILAAVPPVSRDALTHHLAIPKIWISHGNMVETPDMIFSYYPMNLDLLYTIPLLFGNDILPKYIHFFFALGTALLIYSFLKQHLNQRLAFLGSVLFLSTPIIVKLSVTVYVDLGLIFFSWASLYFFLKWCDKQFRLRYLIFSAVLCGLALGTKYNGIILLLIMACMVPIVYSLKQNQDISQQEYLQRYRNSIKGLQWVGVFVLIALILFSPWMIRNIIWKQNPIYPLFDRVFNPPEQNTQFAMQREKQLSKTAFWTRRHVYKESFGETLSIPIRAFFQGQDDNPKFFDGKLNPCLLIFALIAFFNIKDRHLAAIKFHRTIFAVFAIIFILFVLFRVDFRIRYMSPAIPALVVLSVFGIKNMVSWVSMQSGISRLIGAGSTLSLVLVTFFYNTNYVYGQFNDIRPFDYILGKVDRDTYITRYRREYPVIRYTNRTLPKDARVLCLAIGNRTYYVDRKVHLAEDFFERSNGLFRESEIIKKLGRYGTTHIILDKISVSNWIEQLKPEERAIFENVFRKHTKLLFEKYDVLLLEFHA
jgi:4-amino-4-deoxy-L-arabinose transferase-like glycosyltransferase